MDAPERPSRLELEKAWHNRLRRAFSQYQRNLECVNETVDEWRLMVREPGPHPDGVLAIQLARREESLALAEYMRVLRIYRGLVIHSVVPEEAPNEEAPD
jgi:hypothetical protein